MPTTATITPTLGSAPVTLQAGNYSAIDDRRFWGSGLGEGYLSTGSYQVIQRAAGANMTVDVASSVGEGAVVQGDTVTGQGRYFVPQTASNVNVDIATADATNPRNDLVVLEIKDDQHDAGGLNLARVRVITGTPNASAALGDSYGSNGTPALPSSCMALAVINVLAGATSIVTARISDRRSVAVPGLLGFASSTTSFTTSGTHTDFQDEGLSVSITYGAGRRLRLSAGLNLYVPGGTNQMQMRFLRGSTTVLEREMPSGALSNLYLNNQVVSHVFNGPTAGATETFKIQIKGVSNTQVGSFASSTFVKTLALEDLGPQ